MRLLAVVMAWETSWVLALSASERAELAVFCAPFTRSASCLAPVKSGLKSCWLAAALLNACSKLVSGVGGARMLLISGGRLVSVFGAVSPAAIDGVVVGTVTGAIAGAVSPGASAQFQKRVRSIFSADGLRPSTASPSTPRVGNAIVECGGTKASC